jgi:transposase
MDNTTQVMEQEAGTARPGGAARLIRDVRRRTRRRITAEDKIRIVLEGFRKEIPVTDLCRREGISTCIYYDWIKDFMEGGKSRLKKDTLRSATANEVKSVKEENARLKELVAEQALQLQVFKKSLLP